MSIFEEYDAWDVHNLDFCSYPISCFFFHIHRTGWPNNTVLSKVSTSWTRGGYRAQCTLAGWADDVNLNAIDPWVLHMSLIHWLIWVYTGCICKKDYVHVLPIISVFVWRTVFWLRFKHEKYCSLPVPILTSSSPLPSRGNIPYWLPH